MKENSLAINIFIGICCLALAAVGALISRGFNIADTGSCIYFCLQGGLAFFLLVRKLMAKKEEFSPVSIIIILTIPFLIVFNLFLVLAIGFGGENEKFLPRACLFLNYDGLISLVVFVLSCWYFSIKKLTQTKLFLSLLLSMIVSPLVFSFALTFNFHWH